MAIMALLMMDTEVVGGSGESSKQNQMWLSIILILTNAILVGVTFSFNDNGTRARDVQPTANVPLPAPAAAPAPAGAPPPVPAPAPMPAPVPAPVPVPEVVAPAAAPAAAAAEVQVGDGAAVVAAPRVRGRFASGGFGRTAGVDNGRGAGRDGGGGGGMGRGAAVAPLDEPEVAVLRAGTVALEERVQTLMAELAQKDEAISQKDEAISQKDEAISQKDEEISQNLEVITQKDEVISQKDEVISQKDEEIRILRSPAAESEEYAAAVVAPPTQPTQANQPTQPSTQPLYEKRVDPSTHKPYWYNRMTGHSSWDQPPGWTEPQSAAEPPGQSNGQYGHNWHGGSGGAVLGSAGTAQYGHSQPQQGQTQQLNYSMDTQLAGQGDGNQAPNTAGAPLHEKRVDPSTHKPYWYNTATGHSSWDQPPGWAEPQSAAEPSGQSNGQYGHNWHGGSGGAVLGSAGTAQYGHLQPQLGQMQHLDYLAGAHLTDQDDDEYA